MATYFNYNCGYCQTRGAGFNAVYQWPSRSEHNAAHILAVCGVCNNGTTIDSVYLRNATHPSLIQNTIDFPGEVFQIHRVTPIFSSDVPDGVPENIGKFYLQGMENLSYRRWDAAGAMFRKTLDTATKALSPSSKSISLYARINKLVSDGLLTPAMGEWSHEIRLDGNEAVHDEDPETEEDARSAQKFTEGFLNYSFTLPALVASNRAARL